MIVTGTFTSTSNEWNGTASVWGTSAGFTSGFIDYDYAYGSVRNVQGTTEGRGTLVIDVPFPTIPGVAISAELTSVVVNGYYGASGQYGTISATVGAQTAYNGVTRGEQSFLPTGTAQDVTISSLGNWTSAELLSDKMSVYLDVPFTAHISGTTGLCAVSVYTPTVTATFTVTYSVPLYGNALTLGGGGSLPKAVGFLWGQNNGSTYHTIGNANGVTPPSGYQVFQYFADSEYFTYSDGVFTFKKGGTYTIYYGGRGGCNTSGTVRYLWFKIFQNSTEVVSHTTNSFTNQGGGSSTSITASVNDTLYAQIRTNTGAVSLDFFIGIVQTA